MSAGDIAYRIGELVLNYFRTRGVTLTSFELRRIVIALLDNYRQGWPALSDSSLDMAAAFAGSASSNGSGEALVTFIDRDGSRRRSAGQMWNGEAPAAPAPVVTPDVPSALVSLRPRGAQSSSAAGAASPADRVNGQATPPASPVKPQHQESLERQAPVEVSGMGPLEAVMRDDSVSAIFVHGPRSVFVERRGRIEPARIEFRDAQQLDSICGRLARLARAQTAQDKADAFVDGRLDDGTRVVVIRPPLAPGGPCLVLRRPAPRNVTLESLVAEGAMSAQMAAVLRIAMRSRLNILVCGGPETGKTVLLAALARTTLAEERVVTIDETEELRPDVPHHVPLIASVHSGIGAGQIMVAAAALRPDRLLIDGPGESAIAGIVKIAAAGRDGIVVSVPAATPQEALKRLEAALCAADSSITPAQAQNLLALTFHLAVHLERHRDGTRRVMRLADLCGQGETIALRDLIAFEPDGARFAATGLRPNFLPRVARAGLEGALLAAL
jgi:pilus assembly protein CpaF